MKGPINRVAKSLTFRMVVPVVLVVCVIGLGLYLFVLRAVSGFADQQIKEALTNTAKGVYGICDENFTALMQSGRMNSLKAVRIDKALTLGAIEDYCKKNDLSCLVSESGRGELLSYQADERLKARLLESDLGRTSTRIQLDGKAHYFYHLDFKPWKWHIDLIKDTTRYAPLIRRVKNAYLFTGVFLAFGLSVILIVIESLLQKPLRQIIAAMRGGHFPAYRGVYELEFLSNNIANMMKSLKDRTEWLERLYHVSVTGRGDVFFSGLARAISDAMALNVVIMKKKTDEAAFHTVAFAGLEEGQPDLHQLEKGLPCTEIVQRKEPIVVPHGAWVRLCPENCPPDIAAECYVGLPVFDRAGEVIGCIHLFGKEKNISDWDVNYIRTASQMVTAEIELMDKEREQERIRERMFQSQKLESLGLLAGGVAHDFNNLLMGIQGHASLMLCDMDPAQPHYRDLKLIEECVKKASDLTRQLLGLARGGKYDLKATNMNDVLNRTAVMFGRTRREITIHKSFEPKLWPVEIDQTQIEQVLLNLYVNSWHAMPGGGALFLQTGNVILDEKETVAHEASPGRYVRASVTDTGVGMDEETLKKIFDPFFTTREMGRGTGLGLASAYGIIKNHNGFIHVYSERDRGSTFTLYLPASDKDVPLEAKPEATIVAGTETVLLVDDERMILDVGRQMLESMGYRVHTAGSGQEALELFERERDHIHVIIVDMIMPGMSGAETFDRLKGIDPEVKVLLSSGYSLNGQAQSIMERGCGGFVQKPYNLVELSERIREILDKD